MQVTSPELARIRELLESKQFRVTMTDAHALAALFEIAFIDGRTSITANHSR
jgi:hypothetical protein